MRFVDLLTYIFILFGTVVNISFGFLFKIELERIMINNIILTLLFLILNIATKLTIKQNKIKEKHNKSNNKSKDKTSFQVDIPATSDEELSEIKDENDFHEVNPAFLYKKSNKEDE